MLLATLGTLSYNGYQFDGASHVTVHVDFIQDEAQRTILYHQHTITVQATIALDAGTNLTMQVIRRLLGEQGRAFVFISQGFGNDLIVNASGAGVRDVRFGPKPKILSWQPIGSAFACEIEWQVVVCVPVCAQARRSIGIMSMNYEATYALDDRGYTTRTITGSLEIAQTRVGRRVPDTADRYLSSISPTIPTGFKRSQSRSLSKDKSRLDFTITDEQIPSANPYPAGVVRIDATHHVDWSMHGGSAGMLRNVISADIEVAADRTSSHAYLVFLDIVRSRLGTLLSAASGVSVLFDSVSIRESIFSRSSSFSVGYRIPERLSKILEVTGLWRPIGTDWRQWHLSMGATFSPRGHAGLAHLAANDAIVDLCGTDSTIPWNSAVTPPAPKPVRRSAGIINKKPKPDESWIGYDSSVQISRYRPVSRQTILQPPDVEQGVSTANDTTGMQYPPKSGTEDVILEAGIGYYEAMLRGFAIRAGYQIPRPRVLSVGGSPAVETGGAFEQQVVTNWLGVPVYGAKWQIDYMLKHSPGTVRLPNNPKSYVNDNGSQF